MGPDRGRARPVPADGQVLVQVRRRVNLLDSKIRSGEFKFILPYRMPLILGHDVAGEVVPDGTGGAAVQRR